MARLFNTIRQRLLKENRITRYLVYAIGEIVLVMVGILLALQVSTWNQERQARKKEQVLLSALHEEFIANKAQLEDVLTYHRKAMNSTRSIMAEFPINPDSLDLDSFQTKTRHFFARHTFNPSQGIINSLVNTSSFDLISDGELRRLLVSWNDVLEDYQEEEIIAANMLNDQITPYIFSHLKWGRLDDARVDLKEFGSLEYQNWVQMRYHNLKDILGDEEESSELTVIRLTIDRIIELSASKEE